MRRSLTLLLFTLPIWAQFQPAPSAQPYPEEQQGGYPLQYEAQSQYPTQPQQYGGQQPYPNYPAQQQQPQGDYSYQDDQQHGVARIHIVQGDVNVKRGDNGMLTGAIANAPLLSRDHLQTGPGSRAEVELDNANAIRLAPDTDLGFANLAFGNAQAQLGFGTVIVRVLRNSQTQFELDTPNASFHPVMPGDYRISVFDNGTTQVSVRSGRIEMSGPRGTQTLEQGQTLMVQGDANNAQIQQAYPAQRDQFDEWSLSMDSAVLSSRSAQYVGADVYGAEDLDHYGNWVPSEYGQVWTPQGMPQDWSPYSNGQWTYADYYGWTWVGYEPWGWAPYHYGRWFFNTGVGWCWWPGERRGYGFGWSPALVSFFGFGGGLGWVSLAPYESYHPWWGRGYRGYDSFRGGYDLRAYRNAGVRGGAWTSGFNSFAGAGHRYSLANSGQLRSGSVYRGSIPVSAGAAGYRFTDRNVNSNPRFSQSTSRGFFSRPSSSFNNSRGNSGTFNGGGGSYNGSRYSTPAASSNNGGGWQHFGSPMPQRQQQMQQQPQTFSSRPNAGNGESGWHSFGQPSQTPAPRYNAPAPNYNYRAPAVAPRYNAPSAPNYGGGNYRAPAAPNYNYRAPAAAPHYSAPQQQQAPRGNGGGGAPRQSGGGGGSHSSGGNGGGHHR